MKKLTLSTIAMLALLSGIVLAQTRATLTVNDNAFDYTIGESDEFEYAQIALDFNGGQLVVIVSNEGLATTLPEIAVDVPIPTDEEYRTDIFGDDILPEFSDLGNVTVYDYGRQIGGVQFVHEDTTPEAVAQAYLNAMTDLGFEVTEENSGLNSVSFVFQNGSDRFQATFRNDGSDVGVYLRGI